ncbi:hypothetical protein C8R42DRAFT_723357 [Lentinula raphanica]|nr:hypothetical protein C8R42DRAFT_723357 [Lentinula raphanica]
MSLLARLHINLNLEPAQACSVPSSTNISPPLPPTAAYRHAEEQFIAHKLRKSCHPTYLPYVENIEIATSTYLHSAPSSPSFTQPRLLEPIGKTCYGADMLSAAVGRSLKGTEGGRAGIAEWRQATRCLSHRSSPPSMDISEYLAETVFLTFNFLPPSAFAGDSIVAAHAFKRSLVSAAVERHPNERIDIVGSKRGSTTDGICLIGKEEHTSGLKKEVASTGNLTTDSSLAGTSLRIAYLIQNIFLSSSSPFPFLSPFTSSSLCSPLQPSPPLLSPFLPRGVIRIYL